MGISGVDIFAFTCLFFIFFYLGYIIYYAVGLYDLNPFLQPLAITESEKKFLQENFPRISDFNEKDSSRFYKRVAWFRAKKSFAHKSRRNDSRELELLISASGIILTLGLNNYKYVRTVHKIIIYPSDYYSVINKKRHVGEFNWGLKTLVFAADSLREGFNDSDDNLNLAIHEFAHALFFETRGRRSWEALRFQWGFRKLKIMFDENNGTATINDDYLRPYSMTNVFEYFAVLLEHMFENPQQLRMNKPDIYRVLREMLKTPF